MGAAESIPVELRHRVFNLVNQAKNHVGQQRSEALREIWLLTENDDYKIPLCDPSLQFLVLITDILRTCLHEQVTLKNTIACICNLSTCQQNKMVICSPNLGLLPALINLIDESNGVLVQDSSAKKWIYTTLSNCALHPDTHPYLLANTDLRYLEVLKTEMQRDPNYLPPVKSFGCISLSLQNHYAYLLINLRVHEIIVNRLISYGPIPANWPDRNTGMAYWSLNFITSFSSLVDGRKALRSLGKLDFFLQLLSCTEMEGIKASIITSNILCGHEEDLLHCRGPSTSLLSMTREPTTSILQMYPQIFPTLMDVYSATLDFDANRPEVKSLLSRGFGYAIVKMRDISATLRNLSMNDENKAIMLAHPSLVPFVLKSIYLFIDNTSELSAIYHNYREYAGGGGVDFETISYLLELLLQLSFFYYDATEKEEGRLGHHNHLLLKKSDQETQRVMNGRQSHPVLQNPLYDEDEDEEDDSEEDTEEEEEENYLGDEEEEVEEEGGYVDGGYLISRRPRSIHSLTREMHALQVLPPPPSSSSLITTPEPVLTMLQRPSRSSKSHSSSTHYHQQQHQQQPQKASSSSIKHLLQDQFNRPEYHMIEMLQSFLSLPVDRRVPYDAKQYAQQLLNRLLPLELTATSTEKMIPQHIFLFAAKTDPFVSSSSSFSSSNTISVSNPSTQSTSRQSANTTTITATTTTTTGGGRVSQSKPSSSSSSSSTGNPTPSTMTAAIRKGSDKSFIIALQKRLLEMGYDVWREEEGSSLLPSTFTATTSEEYEELLAKAIQYSYLVILCISPGFALDYYSRLIIKYIKLRQQMQELKVVYVMLDKDYHPQSFVPSQQQQQQWYLATTVSISPSPSSLLPQPPNHTNATATTTPPPVPITPIVNANGHHHNHQHLLQPSPSTSNNNSHNNNKSLAPSDHTSPSQMIDGWLGMMIGTDVWYPLWENKYIDSTAHAIAVLAANHAKLAQNQTIVQSYFQKRSSPQQQQQQLAEGVFEALDDNSVNNNNGHSDHQQQQQQKMRMMVVQDLQYYQSWKILPITLSKGTQTETMREIDQDPLSMNEQKKASSSSRWAMCQTASLFTDYLAFTHYLQEELGIFAEEDLDYLTESEMSKLLEYFKPIPRRKFQSCFSFSK